MEGGKAGKVRMDGPRATMVLAGAIMSTQMKEKCPLCLEEMDLTDKQLKPCNCGYEMCLWCWHHIMEMDRKDECGGRCPGCRSFYDKDRILGSRISNQILMEICADKSKLQKEQYNSHKQRLPKLESRVVDEPKDPTAVRVIQRKLVYIVGMPSEFASEKILRQKKFLGQYGKIENIIIDNIGANQHVPDSGRVYVTFSREEEAIRCIQAVNGYILDGRPLKATFGVTRYCHIWLSNKICRKPNCSYVHHKVPQEDICSKDDVALVCARLQHLLGMDLKDPQQRSGTTLPSPGDSSGRTTMNSGKSKDNCYANDARVLANGGSNNSGVLPVATLWDSNLPSNSPSSAVYTILQRRNDHSCINNHSTSDAKSQASALGGYNCSSIKEVTASVKHMQLSNEATEGISLQRSKNINVALQEPNDRFTEQLASGDGASAALLGNDASKPNKMTSTENEMTYTTLLQKSQNVDLVAQGPHDRFTKQLASGDGKPKASGQVGNDSSKSKRITVSENEPHDRITLPRSQNINVVSQRSKDLYHMLTNKLASAIVKCQTEAQERVGCLSIKDKSLSVSHMQLLEGIAVPASHSTSASQNLSDSASMLSNHLTSTHLKLHASAGSEEFPNLEENLMSGNHLQLSCQEKSDDKYQTSEQGGFCSLYNREMDVSANHVQISDQLTESLLSSSSRSHSLNPYTKKMAQDSKESDLNNITISSVASESSPLMPRDAQSHGIGHPSDSDKFAPVCASSYSVLCSTPDGSTSDSCYISDPSDIISWVSECLEDDVDAAEPSNCVGLSCPFGASTIQRSMQFPGSLVSGASNQCVLSPYPSGLQCIGRIESTICYCDVPFSSNAANEKPEHLNRTGNSYASTGVCDAFSHHPTSNVKAARVDTLLQSSPPQSIYNDWTNGNANSSLTNPPVDFSYRMYSLF